MKFSAWFYLLVGILIIGQWGFFLARGAVPELETEPIRLAFHLVSEFSTAICLIISGFALFGHKEWSEKFGLLAAGMLAYTHIVSPGYFAQFGQWPLVGRFFVLLLVDLISIRLLMAGKTTT